MRVQSGVKVRGNGCLMATFFVKVGSFTHTHTHTHTQTNKVYGRGK